MKQICLLICVVLSGCVTAVPKENNAPAVSAADHREWINHANADLSKHYFDNFAYKNYAVPADIWKKWSDASFGEVSRITSEMPEGFVLQVTGHSDFYGPEFPTGNKPGNLQISADRAKSIYTRLIENGINPSKLSFKGAGTSEPDERIAKKSPKQRRITFKIVPR